MLCSFHPALGEPARSISGSACFDLRTALEWSGGVWSPPGTLWKGRLLVVGGEWGSWIYTAELCYPGCCPAAISNHPVSWSKAAKSQAPCRAPTTQNWETKVLRGDITCPKSQGEWEEELSSEPGSGWPKSWAIPSKNKNWYSWSQDPRLKICSTWQVP